MCVCVWGGGGWEGVNFERHREAETAREREREKRERDGNMCTMMCVCVCVRPCATVCRQKGVRLTVTGITQDLIETCLISFLPRCSSCLNMGILFFAENWGCIFLEDLAVCTLQAFFFSDHNPSHISFLS